MGPGHRRRGREEGGEREREGMEREGEGRGMGGNRKGREGEVAALGRICDQIPCCYSQLPAGEYL